MRPDRFTQKMQEALQAAQEAATSRQQQEVANEHLLLALLQQAEGVTRPLLEKLGLAPAAQQALQASSQVFLALKGASLLNVLR